MYLTRAQMAEWRSDQVTREVMRRLGGLLQDSERGMTDGCTINMASSDHTAMKTCFFAGHIEALREILEFKSDEQVDQENSQELQEQENDDA